MGYQGVFDAVTRKTYTPRYLPYTQISKRLIARSRLVAL